MKKLQIFAVLASTALLFAAQTSSADMLDGSYTNEMGDFVPLWDISGNYTNGAGLFASVYSLDQAPSGKLTGAGNFTFVGDVDGIGFNVTNGVLRMGGAVTGSSEAPTVRIASAGSGTGTGSYRGIPLKIAKYTEISVFVGKLNKTILQVKGTLTFTAAAIFVDTHNGEAKAASKTFVYKDVVLPLPATATGAWTLSMDLAPKGKTEFSTGTGTILTSAGNSASFNATAAYAAKADTSAVLLTGTGDSKGSSLALKVTTTGTNLNIEGLGGSLFGQNIEFKAP